MNKKHGFLFGFAVIAIAALFTLAGCDDGSGGDGDGDGGSKLSGTIKMEQAGTNTYTLTLTGLKWEDDVEGSSTSGGGLSGFLAGQCLALNGAVTASDAGGTNPAIAQPRDLVHTVVRNSDTVVTVTMSQLQSPTGTYYWGAGSLKLADFSARATNGGRDEVWDKGSDFVRLFTQEGDSWNYNDYGYGGHDGVLTEADDSASVAFNIVKHQ